MTEPVIGRDEEAGNPEPFRLVYIASQSHSGSTLTELLLDAHPAVFGMGEVKQLNTSRGKTCRCGLEIPDTCPLWGKVAATLLERTGLEFSELMTGGIRSSDFGPHNAALFQAVRAVSGAPVLVDSSKDYHRLEDLLKARLFPIQVIHLVRSPHGVVYSHVKRGRDLVAQSREYAHFFVRTRELLARCGVPVLELRYEELADAPEPAMSRVLSWLGLEVRPLHLRWAEQEAHTVFGNPMRFTRDSTIRRDDQWRERLSWAQRAAIGWWTLPTRVRGRWLHSAKRRLWWIEDRILQRPAEAPRRRA